MRRAVFALALIACRGAPATPDDGGGGPDSSSGTGCAADDPRSPDTEVFVGPSGLEVRWEAFIDAAQDTLDVQMYLFTIDELTARIIAAHQRGVTVRVLLDPDEAGNVDTKTALENAGVAVADDPPEFPFSHAKYLIADGARAIVMSSNFNYGATSSERNYGTVIEDADDIADLQTIFEADWARDPLANLDCTRLIVSPINANERILTLLSGTDVTLDVSVAYITDSSVRTAIIGAHDRGAAVRVILADDASYPDNATTAQVFANQGVPVRILRSVDLHAKLLIADGVAFVGSQNMSPTSLSDNREVGVLVTESAPVATIQSQFESDWAAADTP